MKRLILIAGLCLSVVQALQADPQPLDSSSLAAALTAAAPAKYPLAEAVVVYDRQSEEYTATGTSVFERACLLKLLSSGAVRDFAQLRVAYSPQYNRAEFLWARLIKPGGLVILLPVDSLEDIPQPASEGGTIFWGERDKVLNVPGLEPGDAVEYATREVGGLWLGPGSLCDSLSLLGKLATPYRGQFNRMVMFQTSHPTVEIEYAVSGPRELSLRYAVYNGALQHRDLSDSARTAHLWHGRDLPGIVRESRMPSEYDVGLKLIVTTIPSWEWMSRYEFAQADTCLEPDQAIRDKAIELTAGRADDMSKLRALFYFVAKEIRYLGLSVGEAEGYQPHPARMTFVQKAGVCKDKAALLVAMLKAAGFAAYYTTTAAGNRVEDIPADQSNHAIVAVEDGHGGIIFCDPTMADGSLEILPSHERGQQVVIARPEGDGLRTIPLLPADSNRLEIVSQCAVDTGGAMTGTLVLTGYGGQDTGLRRVFSWQPRSRWDGIARDIVRSMNPSATVTSFEHTQPDSVWQSMVYRIGYAIPGAAFAVGDYRMLRPGLARYEPWWIDPSHVIMLDQRTFPIDLGSNFSVSLEERIALPPGWTVASMPRNVKGKYRTGSWSVSASAGKGAVTFERQITVNDPLIPAGEYAAYRKAMIEYLDARQGWIVLRTGHGE
jgi:transglutaminase-like putative cysteine protease